MNKLSATECAVSFMGGGVLTAGFCNNIFVSICGGVFAIILVKYLKRLDEKRNSNAG